MFGNKNTTKVVYQYLSKKPTRDAENVGSSVVCDCVPYFFCFYPIIGIFDLGQLTSDRSARDHCLRIQQFLPKMKSEVACGYLINTIRRSTFKRSRSRTNTAGRCGSSRTCSAAMDRHHYQSRTFQSSEITLVPSRAPTTTEKKMSEALARGPQYPVKIYGAGAFYGV